MAKHICGLMAITPILLDILFKPMGIIMELALACSYRSSLLGKLSTRLWRVSGAICAHSFERTFTGTDVRQEGLAHNWCAVCLVHRRTVMLTLPWTVVTKLEAYKRWINFFLCWSINIILLWSGGAQMLKHCLRPLSLLHKLYFWHYAFQKVAFAWHPPNTDFVHQTAR